MRDSIKAVGKLAKAVFTPESDQARERLAICAGDAKRQRCEHFEGFRCKRCGCFTRYKARLESETCPEGKW